MTPQEMMGPFHLLELNVISAQDIAPLGRNMRTYAVSWVHPDRKLSTRVDTQGHTQPTWNDKFVFRVHQDFLYSDSSAITIDIYALHWFKDIHVGTVRLLLSNLLPPPSAAPAPPLGMRFVALQVRRPSGRPQGILNIAFTLLDTSMRSMPLYPHNTSTVHIMGDKDAHNHVKPDLRRTKSDTSSMLAARRPVANHDKANSAVSGSELSVKSKSKSKSKSDSVLSSGEENSDAVLPWKVKSGKASPNPDDILHIHPPLSYYDDTNDDAVQQVFHNPNYHEDDHDHNAHFMNHSQQQHYQQQEYDDEDGEEEEEEEHELEHIPVSNFHYEVRASPKPHYLNTPVPQYINSPKPQFLNSPAPKFRNSPAPKYMASPAPKYKNSPARQYMSSPAPQFRNSPVPQYMSSPMPQFKNSPAPQHMASPKPQFKNSPAPQYMASPAPQFRNSPKPQFMNSPKPQFKNSPQPQYMASPKPQFKNSPLPQFRSSPVVSKFNPAVAYGGSRRGTPLHPLAKASGGFEYMTPRRSNLGNMGPVTMTESELGPSPSEVAAKIARNPVVYDGENSTVGGWSLAESVEGLQSKLERWRTDLPPVIDQGESSSFPTSSKTSTKASTKTSAKSNRHSRRHTDGGSGSGLFSCFSNICGVECSIVCGGDPKGKKKLRRRAASAEDNNTSSLL